MLLFRVDSVGRVKTKEIQKIRVCFLLSVLCVISVWNITSKFMVYVKLFIRVFKLFSIIVDDKKKTRKREKPQKKWLKEENEMLLDFLLDNPEFEKPTSQIYYKRFIESSKIEASWDNVRCKVRYLKSTFLKAEAWRKSTGAGLDDDDGCSSIKG